MFGNGWRLHRSPLAPSVPLEGSETVQGLRTLERLRAASLLSDGSSTSGGGPTAAGAARNAAPPAPSRRRRYQRYKGPFIEHLSTDDLKKDPRPWSQFSGRSEEATFSFSIPASLDFLCERLDENCVVYATNYLRVVALVVMLTLYLKPIAVFGAAALALSITYNINRALEQQRRAADPQNHQQQRRGGGVDQSPLGGAILAAATWLIVALTKCIPIILLGLVNATLVVLTHACVRKSPSEMRYRGRTMYSYTFAQVVRRQAVPPGNDPLLVFKQLLQAGVGVVVGRLRLIRRWVVYYALAGWDVVRRPFTPALRSAPLATSWG